MSRPEINATLFPSSTSVYFQVVMSYLSFLCARLLDLRNETRAARVIQGAWRKYRLKKDLQLYKVGLEFGTTAKGWSFMDPIYYIYPKWLGVRVYSHVSSFVDQVLLAGETNGSFYLVCHDCIIVVVSIWTSYFLGWFSHSFFGFFCTKYSVKLSVDKLNKCCVIFVFRNK